MTMEPNNIEKQIREKLNSREIKPSENAWDRLDAMLTVAEKPKKNYRWMYFAASFLGFILIATVFFNQTQDAIDVPLQKVVLEQIEDTQNEQNTILEITPENTENQVVSTSEKAIVKEKDNSIISSSTMQNENLPSKTAVASSNKTIEAPVKIQLPSSNSGIGKSSEVNVDANTLLAAVDNGYTSQEQAVVHNSKAVKVNSNDLLSQVDGELELSFRERVLKSVNKKYHDVKVAVTKRNLE